MSAPARERFGILEAGRGFAALAVVLHHAAMAADAFTNGELAGYFSYGAFGVDFFFVLSGFIISHAHRDDPQGRIAAGRFISRRIRRIYIPYLPVSLGLIALYLALPGLSPAGGREWGWFSSLTLLPSGHPPALSVAWTLVYEMVFYSVFLLFFFTRYFSALMIGWAAIVISLQGLGLYGYLTWPLFVTLFNPLILEFLAGMLMARLWRAGGTGLAGGWKLPLAVGIGGICLFFLLPGLHRVFFGLALAPVVLALVRLEAAFSLRTPRVLLFMGAASYAVYLIHNPVQSIVARLSLSWQLPSVSPSWAATFIACVLVSTAIGVMYHLCYERPVLHWLSSVKYRRMKSLTD